VKEIEIGEYEIENDGFVPDGVKYEQYSYKCLHCDAITDQYHSIGEHDKGCPMREALLTIANETRTSTE
jgi:hypothetical protein